MSKRPPKHSSTGFTLIELITVVVMAGILFAIAAPSWLAFANRQRINGARDQIARAVQRTQAESIRTRRTQTLVIDRGANPVPTLKIEPADTVAQSLGNGQLEANMVTLQTSGNVTRIAFDPQGNLNGSSSVPANPTLPIKLTVGLPNNPSAKSCVIVETLIGATRTDSGNGCN